MSKTLRIGLFVTVLFAFTGCAGSASLNNAAWKGDIAAVRSLIKSKADVNEKSGPNGATPLITAAKKGQTEIVKILLDNGADVNAKDNLDTTALMWAAFRGHTETVKTLLDKDADVNAKGKVLLSKFKGEVPTDLGTARGLNGVTALMLAVFMDYTETVKVLLENGANVNATADDGTTALLLAQERGHREMVHLLQMAGATLLGRLDRATKFEVGYYCPSDNQRAWAAYNSASQQVEKEELEEAKRLYLKAIDLDPKFCDAMDNLGLIFRGQGNINQAIYWYRKSVDTFFYNPVPHGNLAVVYSMQGKFAEALEEYKMVVKIDPDNPEGFYGLGFTFIYLKQPQEAVTQLKKAEELYNKRLSPLVTHARLGLGLAYHELGECQKARSYLEGVYEENKENPLVNLYLGECYTTQEPKDLKQAKKYFLKAQSLGMEVPSDLFQRQECDKGIDESKLSTMLILDESLRTASIPVAAAWMFYGARHVRWMECKYFEQNPGEIVYHFSFAEELDAREGMLLWWASLKGKDSKTSDPYLDQLLAVKEAGFLAEYVWFYLRVPDWAEKPDGLKSDEFSQWQRLNLGAHKPQTRAFARSKVEGD